jgi:glycosyltransferase involved in cell wall biosynthesis
LSKIHFLSVVRFSNAHAIGVAAINFAEELSIVGKRVIVITAQHDKIQRKGIWVLKIGRHLPYSLQFIMISFLTLTVSVIARNWHTFEIPSFRALTFHAHSDFWDKSKLVRDFNTRFLLRNFNRNLSKLGIRLAVMRKTIVCFPSKSLANRTRRSIPTSRERDIILPNVLSFTDELYSNSSFYKKKTFPEYRIGFIAQGDAIYKGLPLAMHIVENSLQPASLLVAGLDKFNGKDDSFEKCIFLGALTRSEIRDFYLEIDFLLICSNYESFSMTALEALFLGTPVIYTGEMGINEFLPKDFFYKAKPDSQLDFNIASSACTSLRVNYDNIVAKRAQAKTELFKQLNL